MSKEPTLELKYGDVKKFKASTTANPNNKIFIDLKINRFTRLLVISNLFKNKNIRHNVDYNKINFTTESTAYKLDDATYIGTVGSTITDVSMDIYYVTEVVDDNGVNVNIGYFIAFPTLLVIPDVTTLATRKIELDAVVFGIEEDLPIMKSSSLEIPYQKSVKAYLKNISFTAPVKIGNKLITFPGLDEDSLYNTTEVYTTTLGQCNGDTIQPNQYLDLGTISALVTGFDPLVGINIDIAGIKQTTHNTYAYSMSERVNMKSGSLCIPLNF